MLGRSSIKQIALLLDGGKLRVALIRDQMKQRIAHTLIRNLQHGLPFRATCIVAEFNRVGGNSPKLDLKLVILKLPGIETDILLPLTEVISPVIKCCDPSHCYFPSNFATRFSL